MQNCASLNESFFSSPKNAENAALFEVKVVCNNVRKRLKNSF